MKDFLDGNEAVVRGAIDAGCDFFAGYPITPATQILLGMIRELPRVGGVAIQAEDEIASMGFCIGASMTGKRPMTATSGPGMSLYSENIGLAIMGEVPLVIVNVQRMGPATGGATTGAEGDVQFMRWITSGGYPLIVLCPRTVAETYTLTMKSFQLAEKFRTPVILLTEKDLAQTRESVEISEMKRIEVLARKSASTQGEFLPYKFNALSDIPAFSPIGGKYLVRFTTSIHDEKGELTIDPVKIDRKLRHLERKIMDAVDDISIVDADIQEGAETLIISYGVTARSVDEAIITARQNGKKVSSLAVLSLWPVPEKEIHRHLAGIRRVVVAEQNLGQYRIEIERIFHVKNPKSNDKVRESRDENSGRNDGEVIGVNKVTGEIITPQEILERAKLL
ncbi:MAG: pyruvate flavodoxin/ferredoxin oxidoreductase [Acidobacteriota bacterium]